ncbi:MAG: hypothetical protein ACPG77_20185, partial [Nannocystaceae bacterium]
PAVPPPVLQPRQLQFGFPHRDRGLWLLAAVLATGCLLPEDIVVGEKPDSATMVVEEQCGLDPCLCSAGTCTQHCATPDLRLCRFECAATATCMSICPGGDCVSSCAQGASCELDCPEGGCSASCEAGSNCNMSCAGGNCTMTCADTETCTLDCPGGNCEVQCLGPNPCTITGCTGSCTVMCGAMPCMPPPG